MEEKLKRPGGELASRPLHFFWIVDCSGSMYGEKIGTVNHAIQSTIPEMVDAASDNPNAQLLVRTLKFSTGASWVTSSPVPVEDFAWDDLYADGVTDLGKAFDLLAAQLTIPPMSERALPPVLVLISDGCPTDDYKESLNRLLHLPWGKKSVKIAISIGQDADDSVLTEFTGNRELVLQANNPQALVKMIKWASTAASVVSAPVSRVATSQLTPAALVSAADQLLDQDDIAKSAGSAPLVLDMNNIPSPDDVNENEVW
ncbi:MAG: tellurium resistance protein [Eubacteriales bacterium]|nr:tellurium resistance protein [Eubacteriales bacterium]